MTPLVVVQVTITNLSAFREHLTVTAEAVAKHGGKASAGRRGDMLANGAEPTCVWY